MGDRVLMQVVSDDRKRFSPVIYMHWEGSNWENIVQKLAAQMHDRLDDVDYSAARLVQICATCFNSNDNLGLGIWNTDHILTAEDSHGDNGIVLINAKDFTVEHIE
jgi:hypothetical protein